MGNTYPAMALNPQALEVNYARQNSSQKIIVFNGRDYFAYYPYFIGQVASIGRDRDNLEEQPSSVPAFVYETSLDLAQFDGGRDIALTDYTFDPANSVLQDSITTNTTHEEDTP
jgi:hypothetical protein